MKFLIDELKKIEPDAMYGFLITEKNIKKVNKILKKASKRKVKINNYIDYESNVIWSDDNAGYGKNPTTRIDSIRGFINEK